MPQIYAQPPYQQSPYPGSPYRQPPQGNKNNKGGSRALTVTAIVIGALAAVALVVVILFATGVLHGTASTNVEGQSQSQRTDSTDGKKDTDSGGTDDTNRDKTDGDSKSDSKKNDDGNSGKDELTPSEKRKRLSGISFSFEPVQERALHLKRATTTVPAADKLRFTAYVDGDAVAKDADASKFFDKKNLAYQAAGMWTQTSTSLNIDDFTVEWVILDSSSGKEIARNQSDQGIVEMGGTFIDVDKDGKIKRTDPQGFLDEWGSSKDDSGKQDPSLRTA